MQVFRPSIPIGYCTTLHNASVQLGGGKNLFYYHRSRSEGDFPKPVAMIGGRELFVFSELEAYYQSFLWSQADKSINELRA